MGNYFSPSVNVIESDLSTTVPSLPTSICGLVGEFQWGPCNQRVKITNDKELIDVFGDVDDNNYISFFSAWNFLQYGNDIRIVRVLDEDDYRNSSLEISDATAGSSVQFTAQILNDDAVSNYIPSFGLNAKLQVMAKYPGSVGDNISVAVANYDDFSTANVSAGVSFVNVFEYAPQTSDEFALVVLYNDTIVEKYIVSFDTTAKDYEGNNNYVEEYVNRRSKYILCFEDSSNTDKVDSIEATDLSGGVGNTPTNTEIIAGYELFDNPEETDVNMLIDGGNTNSTIQQYIIDNILEVRRDLVAYFTAPKDTVVGVANITTAITNLVTYRTTTLNRSTTYAALFGNWKYQYDQYSDKNRWLPVSGDIAGITARTHYDRDPWFSIMGYNRGLMKNVSKLAINPNRSHRDTLQNNFINPIINDPDVGPVLLGQKTLYSAPSTFSRLDIRWLFVTIERAISVTAKYVIGEKITDFTMRRFKGVIEPYLRDVRGREGIEDSYVQCDNVNNTAETKARNEFHAGFYIKPTHTAEYIVLQFVNVKGSISFEEIIKKSI